MDVASDDREIAAAIRLALEGLVGPRRYELWFGPRTHLSLVDGRLRVGVVNRFYQDWVRDHFRGELEAACQRVVGYVPQVTFHIDAALSTEPAAAQTPGSPQTASPDSPPLTDSSPAASQAPHAAAPLVAFKVSRSTVASAKTRRPWLSFDEFVTGPENQLARQAAECVVQRPGETSPLVIHGATAVGKTHLLEAIAAAFRRARPGRPAVMVSAEQFTTGFLSALHGSGLPSFRRKYRGVELLIIDDIQFFIGKKATLVELLSTTDALAREGKQLVFAADRAPDQLAELGRELVTRLEGGLVCGMQTPEHATRWEIVRRLGTSLNLSASDDVWRFVADRVTSHPRALRGAMLRIDMLARARGTLIDEALAREALSEVALAPERNVRLPEITAAVCATLGVETSSLHTGVKTRQVNAARMLAMWLARKHTSAALSEIGRFFGRRSHSTVVAAQKKIDGLLGQGAAIKLAGRPCSLDDAVRQIEQRLRAG